MYVHSDGLCAAQVALVGAPNVGKSSLVQLLSSGLPEVQNYPFTTRSIKMGHFYVAGRRHQVTGDNASVPGCLLALLHSTSVSGASCSGLLAYWKPSTFPVYQTRLACSTGLMPIGTLWSG